MLTIPHTVVGIIKMDSLAQIERKINSIPDALLVGAVMEIKEVLLLLVGEYGAMREEKTEH